MKSPVEYTHYSQQERSGTSVVTALPVNTPAEATFAQIAPLLSQNIIHRQQHNQPMEHPTIAHSQSVIDDRLLMTAPSAHQRIKEEHELVLRGPGIVQQHSQQQLSVISNTASLNMQPVESPGEEYRRSSMERIHRPSSVEMREPSNKHLVEEPLQTSPYQAKYNRYENDGCFQTVVQVCYNKHTIIKLSFY